MFLYLSLQSYPALIPVLQERMADVQHRRGSIVVGLPGRVPHLPRGISACRLGKHEKSLPLFAIVFAISSLIVRLFAREHISAVLTQFLMGIAVEAPMPRR